jgi:Fe-S cluster assembly iron-binding protein IscA
VSTIDDHPVKLIALTANAAAKVRELLAQEGEAPDRALRLAVDDGSCSEHHYAFGFDRVRDDDMTV